MSKIVRTKIVTPKGTARWAKVVTPDTKFNPDGVFSIDVLIPEDECKNLCKVLDTLVEDMFEETKAELKPAKAKALQIHPPYQIDYDEESGEETGFIVFKFTKNAIITTKKGEKVEVKTKLFDSAGTPINTMIAIGNGSTVQVSGQASPWYVPATGKVGAKLYLDAVKVCELVEFGGGDASSYGFDTEEDGFTVDPNNDEAPNFDLTDDDF